MSSRQPGRSVARSVSLAGLAAAGLVLTGCGVSTGIHPGSAAVIGDESLSMSKIDTTASRYCQAYAPQISQQSQRVPMRYLRQFVAANLSQRLLGRPARRGVRRPADLGVRPAGHQGRDSSSRRRPRSCARRSSTSRPAASTSRPCRRRSARSCWRSPVPSSPTAKAALQRGQVATEDWLKDHSISLDPVLGIAADGGQFKATTDQTSYPLSTLASQGAAAAGASQPDPAYTAALTPSQVCG